MMLFVLESYGVITPADAVQLMLDTFSKLTEKDTGRFLNNDGSTLPW